MSFTSINTPQKSNVRMADKVEKAEKGEKGGDFAAQVKLLLACMKHKNGDSVSKQQHASKF